MLVFLKSVVRGGDHAAGTFADMPVPVRAHVDKRGHVVDAHTAIRHVRVESRTPKLDHYIKKHGGEHRVRAMVEGFHGPQRDKLVSAMAGMEGLDADAVRARLGMPLGDAQPDLFGAPPSTPPDASPVVAQNPPAAPPGQKTDTDDGKTPRAEKLDAKGKRVGKRSRAKAPDLLAPESSGTLQAMVRDLSLDRDGSAVSEIAARAGMDEDETLDNLFASPIYCLNADGTWTTQDLYLTGNLWNKLDQANGALRTADGHVADKLAEQVRALEDAIALRTSEAPASSPPEDTSA